KQMMLALGVYPIVSLAEARKRRDTAKKLVSDGIDPSQKKKEAKIEESGALTFEAVARDWHASCSKKWSASHSERVLKSLVDNLFPALGKRRISELKTRDLLVPIKVV
ncbi:tyrosine-type recombinase/integrase, partial [Escherichia coli]|uniref:tyrosine-type recombinase/integrase n=1 Tax=Escherichia coli TaxID=562 RepID=UPI0021175CB3